MEITCKPYSSDWISDAVNRLNMGDPIITPNPSPLPYSIIGPSFKSVNSLKQRSVTQPLAMLLLNPVSFLDKIKLDPIKKQMALDLLVNEHVTLLIDISYCNAIDIPNIYKNKILLFYSSYDKVSDACSLSIHKDIYVSSANITGKPTACYLPQLIQYMKASNYKLNMENLLIIDGTEAQNKSMPHGSTTTVELNNDNSLKIVRSGIQNLLLKNLENEKDNGLIQYANALANKYSTKVTIGI